MKFRLSVDIDNANTWMRTEFSLGMVLTQIGNHIAKGNPNFQEMIRHSQEIKDAYGNVVGHFEVFP